MNVFGQTVHLKGIGKEMMEYLEECREYSLTHSPVLPLSRMDRLMGLQDMRIVEALAAYLAGVRPLLRVHIVVLVPAAKV